MPSIWSYSDPQDKGYGLFKRRLFTAFSEFGWDTCLFEIELGSPGFQEAIAHEAETCGADVILLINQNAASFASYLQQHPGPRLSKSRKLTWFLDDPQFLVAAPFENREHVFVFDDTYLPAAKAWGGASVAHLPLAADMTEAGHMRPDWQCPVSFVGGLQDQSYRRKQLPPEMADYCSRLVDLHLADRRRSFRQLVVEEPYAPGKQITLSGEVCHFLYWEANIKYRLTMLESLTDFGLVIYGNEDWIPLTEGSPLRQCFKGEIDPVRELPDLFASSTININLHSVQCRGSLNQRDYNAPVAGGFLVSDWVPGAGRFFDPVSEAVTISDAGDLKRTVEYYLQHEDERTCIVENARRRVFAEHTYAHRVETILKYLDKK